MASHHWRMDWRTRARALLLPIGITLAAHPAAAQSIDSVYLQQLPAGTNLNEDAGQFEHFNGLQYDNGGPKITSTSFYLYIDTVRYAHHFNIAGYTAITISGRAAATTSASAPLAACACYSSAHHFDPPG